MHRKKRKKEDGVSNRTKGNSSTGKTEGSWSSQARTSKSAGRYKGLLGS